MSPDDVKQPLVMLDESGLSSSIHAYLVAANILVQCPRVRADSQHNAFGMDFANVLFAFYVCQPAPLAVNSGEECSENK